MKSTSIAVLTVLFLLTLFGTASADTYFKGVGVWNPEQGVAIKPSVGGDVTPTTNDSFGGYAEAGFYSPGHLLSFGIEGGFNNLRAFNPIAGVENMEAQIFSLMGKMCAHVQNKSKLTPYVCGGAGYSNIDPSLSIPGGIHIQSDSVNAAAYLAEAGVRYKINRHFSLIGGGRFDGTFNRPVVGVTGVPGLSAEIDLDRYGVFFGIEF